MRIFTLFTATQLAGGKRHTIAVIRLIEKLLRAAVMGQSFARLTLSEDSECRSRLVSQRSETHRLRFRSLTLGEVGDLFSYVQRLQQECQGWLLADSHDARRIVEMLVMEQFLKQLPEVTARWVRDNQPETLNKAIDFVKRHGSSTVVAEFRIQHSQLSETVLYHQEDQLKQKKHLEAMEQIQQSFDRLTLSEDSECRSRLVSQRSETHRLRFRSLTLGEVGDLFSYVQRLQQECQGWLLADSHDARRIVEMLVMEQFLKQLPEVTARWVRDNQPETLNKAIDFVKRHGSSAVVAEFRIQHSQLSETVLYHQEDQLKQKKHLEAMEQIQQSFDRLTLSEDSGFRSRLVSPRSETHRLRFRSLTLGEVGDLFSYVQQLQQECQGWLLADSHDARRIVETLVMEQFLKQLPEVTAHWVLYNQPATLNEAIYFVERHRSLSLFLLLNI
ncbi:uncharacterized protein LOC113641783 [Tachysurus fulvidraco]|uniref:uncharacterized protein LOC113641783 n=1 Tax=Tachysurus fulvidraco TaxID=1234273 RepID=UPI001FEEACA5|nr:uncharacterized protein LOC113641783 [Tachysurus fulvidraco]